MTNRFETAAARLGARLQQRAGRSIVYLRGTTEIPLTAWGKIVEYEVVQGNGPPTLVRSHDFGIIASELGVTPKDGDQIRETTASGEEVTHTVSKMAPRPCFEPEDAAGMLLGVHTKR